MNTKHANDIAVGDTVKLDRKWSLVTDVAVQTSLGFEQGVVITTVDDGAVWCSPDDALEVK